MFVTLECLGEILKFHIEMKVTARTIPSVLLCFRCIHQIFKVLDEILKQWSLTVYVNPFTPRSGQRQHSTKFPDDILKKVKRPKKSRASTALSIMTREHKSSLLVMMNIETRR